MKSFLPLVTLFLYSLVAVAQVPEVFSRLQDAEEYWYDVTQLKATNKLDTCPTSHNLSEHFETSFPASEYYEPLALDYARFFARHECEALSLYEEVALYAGKQYTEPHYLAFFQENGYLAVFLTGLNPAFEGEYGRKGFWALTYPVAKKYGLRVDELIDERFSIVHATRAAWWNFFDLKRVYQDPDLVRLGFVSSPVLLEKYIQASIANDPMQGLLPLEAAQTLFELDLLRHLFNADWIAVSKNRVEAHAAQYTDVFPRGMVRFDAVEKILQLKKGSLKKMNPVFLQEKYPANYRNTPLKIRKQYASKFQQLEDTIQALSLAMELGQLEAEKVPEPIAQATGKAKKYKVKRGDALGLIAERNGVSITDLMRWNQLKNDKIFIGQKLLIYTDKKEEPQEVKAPAPAKKEPKKLPTGTPKIYVVKEGDNLWMISQLYPGVTADDIAEWNSIKNNQIYPGQQLKIYNSND